MLPVVAAALISGGAGLAGTLLQNANQKGQAPGLPQIGGPGNNQTLGNTAAKILETAGKSPAGDSTGAALAGASPQQLGMLPIEADRPLVPIHAPKDTPHNQTLKEVITAKGAEIKAPTTDDIIKKGELKTKGDGMFAGMSALEKAALASTVASAMFQRQPGPAPPGLPNINGPNLKPTI